MSYVNMDAYNQGWNDALQWVLDKTFGDNYKLQVKDKLDEGIINVY